MTIDEGTGFGQKKVQSEIPLIALNDRENFFRYVGSQKPPALSRRGLMKLCPSPVVDSQTLELIQATELHEAIDNTRTVTGKAMLLRSLIQPSTDLGYIRSRQDAIAEIASNDRLRSALKDFVIGFADRESVLYKFLNKAIYALFPYLDLRKTRRAAAEIAEMSKSIPRPESQYLGFLVDALKDYAGSGIDSLMRGSIHKTFRGLKSGKEVGFFTPKQTFIPHRFSHWILAGPAVAAAPYVPSKIGVALSLSPMMTTAGLAATGLYLLYGLFFKPIRDTERFIEPLRARCIADSRFGLMIDAIARIDELLSCREFARAFPGDTVIAKVYDREHHFFEAEGMKSPVLAKDISGFVPNDIRMNGEKLTFISGPNSGGKTTLCKSIVQNQLLAQMGCHVLAKKASINIADRICYQAPKFDGLRDEEGRFGTELKRTRDIFFLTTPKSLVILDELAEGTTHEERLDTSLGIMNDFFSIGNNTILVTHNHALVDRFMDRKKGRALMTEFSGQTPTYKITPGISRVSHAEKIAEKIGFSSEHRKRFLKEKGYL